ncbi:MAG: hypothetical protein MJ240_12770 [Kiritimatiellae bacterium]|nr:hypothetical protein [Kiritimatiellia bacterium]
MNMKALMVVALACVCALQVSAQRRARGKAAPTGAGGGAAVAQGRDAMVQIDTPARPGGTSLIGAPNFQCQVGGQLMPPVGGKPRKWIVLEMKYTTQAKWQDELTFHWHVLLDSSKAKEKDPKNPVAPYSYYNVDVRYVDIKQGPHAACVCLPPSVAERYGEPCSVSVLITNKEGDELALHTENQFGKLPDGKWWERDDMMNQWKDKKTGENMIARRQGLVDRSKTPFALINSSDYELVQ